MRAAGASALLVNGVMVDLANFDLYAFLDMLRREVLHRAPSHNTGDKTLQV